LARRLKFGSETLLSPRLPRLSDRLVQASRTISATVLLVGLSLAQQPPKEPVQPAFRAQTDLVIVPFQVRRGSRSVSDLNPTDVVLLEDGVPRGFFLGGLLSSRANLRFTSR
jgi:hypothetical protein